MKSMKLSCLLLFVNLLSGCEGSLYLNCFYYQPAFETPVNYSIPSGRMTLSDSLVISFEYSEQGKSLTTNEMIDISALDLAHQMRIRTFIEPRINYPLNRYEGGAADFQITPIIGRIVPDEEIRERFFSPILTDTSVSYIIKPEVNTGNSRLELKLKPLKTGQYFILFSSLSFGINSEQLNFEGRGGQECLGNFRFWYTNRGNTNLERLGITSTNALGFEEREGFFAFEVVE